MKARSHKTLVRMNRECAISFLFALLLCWFSYTTKAQTGPPYPVSWSNKIGVSANGSLLTKNVHSQVWTNSGAVSWNILPADTDGWIEFATTSSSDFIIGLSVNNIINYTEFSNGIHIHDAGNNCFAYEGTASTPLTLWQAGDVFRISREGAQVKYYQNNAAIRVVNVNPGLVLNVKTTIKIPNKSTPTIITSFDRQLVLQDMTIGMNGNTGLGSISLTVAGGTEPYSYNWSNGEHTGAIMNKPPGAYTVTVSDAVGRMKSQTYSLKYRVNWINKIGLISEGPNLKKHISSRVWTNSGAVSSNLLAANTDGWMEFSTAVGSDFIVGLATNNTINYTDFTNCIQIHDVSSRSSTLEGSTSTELDSWRPGDVFRISREGSTVKYYRNGVAVRTVLVDAALVLKVKVTIKEPNKSTPSITTSFWSSDGVSDVYYSIANGNWTTPSIWSLSENGPPSTVYPDDIDKVIVKGHEVMVDSDIKSAGIVIKLVNDNTRLMVKGSVGVLTVKGNVVMNREHFSNTAEVLVVRDNAKLLLVNQ